LPTQVTNNPWVEAQRKTFYHLGLFWYFSDDGSGNIYFRTSTDGVTWSSATTITSGTGYRNPAIYVDYVNNKVYLSWNDGAGKHFFHKLGTLNSNGTITWGANETVATITESNSDRQNIWVDSSGTVWIVGYGYNASTSEPWYLFKKPSGGSWTQVTKQTDNRPTQLSVFVLDNGKIVVVRTCDGFGSADNYLKVWVSADGGSTWSSYTYSTYSILHHCAVIVGNIVHISFIDKTNWDVYYIRFDGTSNSFSTAVKLWDDSTSIRTTISRDSDGNLYVFWNRDGTAGAILKYVRSADGGNTWSSPTTVDSSADTTDQNEGITTEYLAYNKKISIYYNRDGATWFAYINTPVQYSLSLSDSFSLSDSISKLTSRQLSDGISLSDSLVKQASKSLSETITLSDSIQKKTSRLLSDALSLSDSLTKQTSRLLSDSLSLSDSLTKQILKPLSDSFSLSDILLRGRLLTDSISLTDLGIVKSTTKQLSETISLSDLIQKKTSHFLFDGFSLSDSLSKQSSKLLTDNISLTDYLIRGRILTDTISLTDNLTKQSSKLLTDNISLSDSFAKQTLKLLADTLSLVDSIAKQSSKLLTDNISLSDVIIRGRILVDTISLSDSLSKRTWKQLSETISLIDRVLKETDIKLTDYITIYDSFMPIRRIIPPKPAVIPYVTPEGKLLEVKYWTLDQLMFGFILGVSKLGYGVLLPKYSTFELPEGKNNPEVIKLIVNKVTGAINRLSLLPWAYGQYNKPEEMADIHKSERTSQYDLLQTQRRFVEDWVRNRLAKYKLDAMRIRQYQNAVLQAVGWKAKRHPWGFKPFKDTPEDQFKAFWIDNWKSQGLDENILRELYDSLESIIQAIRDVKTSIGEKVGQTRRRLAGSV